MKNIVLILWFIFLLISCKKETLQKVDVSKINAKVIVKRFDTDFYSANAATLPALKKEYPLFFPKSTPDSIWLSKINDKEERELFAETQKVYSDITPLKKQLKSLFKHIKYYQPKFNEPKVITLLTNIDYDNRIIYADSLLLISFPDFLSDLSPAIII